MENKKDTGFGVKIDILKIRGITTTRIINELANEEVVL